MDGEKKYTATAVLEKKKGLWAFLSFTMYYLPNKEKGMYNTSSYVFCSTGNSYTSSKYGTRQ